MDNTNQVEAVKKYSVVLGFTMIIIFIFPCVLLAFFSKYLVRSSPTSKAPRDKSLRAVTSTATVTSDVLGHLVQYAHNKLTFLEKIGGGFGTCSELWKAHLPPEPSRKTGSTAHRSEDHTSVNVVCIRKLQEAHELHFQCIQAEFNLLSSISPHPHILNLVGITVNFRRPSFLVQGASPSDPAGLLFEYPWYGRLFAFLSTKRRAIVAKNRSIWAPLEQQGPLSSELPYLLQAYLCDFAVSSSDAGRPFLKPLGDPLDDLDLCVFAMQITSAMEYLASKKVLHKRLCSECIAVSKDFHLKVADVDFEVQQLHKSTPNFPIIRKSPSGRRMFRWDAPEVLSNKGYTEKSEVWRFGMTLWEVASLGDTPSEDMPDSSTLLSSLQCGHHPQKPDGCPDHLYQIMECCWDLTPDKRPTFSQVFEMLVTEFDSMAETRTEEPLKPSDNASGASSLDWYSSSPDRLIPPVSLADYTTSSSLEQRRSSYPLTHRSGAAKTGPPNGNGPSEATTKV